MLTLAKSLLSRVKVSSRWITFHLECFEPNRGGHVDVSRVNSGSFCSPVSTYKEQYSRRGLRLKFGDHVLGITGSLKRSVKEEVREASGSNIKPQTPDYLW